jgi:hypothetical protein
LKKIDKYKELVHDFEISVGRINDLLGNDQKDFMNPEIRNSLELEDFHSELLELYSWVMKN